MQELLPWSFLNTALSLRLDASWGDPFGVPGNTYPFQSSSGAAVCGLQDELTLRDKRSTLIPPSWRRGRQGMMKIGLSVCGKYVWNKAKSLREYLLYISGVSSCNRGDGKFHGFLEIPLSLPIYGQHQRHQRRWAHGKAWMHFFRWRFSASDIHARIEMKIKGEIKGEILTRRGRYGIKNYLGGSYC